MSLEVAIKKKVKGFELNAEFEVKGEYMGILGASGCGKSMTLKCIAGVEVPDEGRIVLNGRVLYDSDKKINVRPQERNIGYLFQSYALFPYMTVEENIGIGLKTTGREKTQRVSELIKTVHLQGNEKKYPSMLSGGQQQRVALARILAYEPEVLLLDEPFSALDAYLKEQIQDEVMELLASYGGEVVIVTHDRDEAFKLCSRLVIYDRGRTILSGKTKEVFANPRLLAAARLTGCKNISRCRMLSDYSIYAIDWDIVLHTRHASKNHNFVGIRAHSFQMAESTGVNTVVCKIKKVVEDVFEYTILFENADSTNAEEIVSLQYKLKKSEWDHKKKDHLFLRVPEEAVLLLE